MIEPGNVFYFSVVSAAFLFSITGLWLSAIISGNRWNKRFFLIYFFVFMLCSVSGFIDIILFYNPSSYTILHLFGIIECLILSLPLPMLTIYLLHYSKADIIKSRLFHIVLGLLAVYMILLVVSMFTDRFSIIMSDNHFKRGSYYPLVLLPLISILLLNLAGTIYYRKSLSRKAFFSLLISIIPMTVTFSIHFFIDIFFLIDISYVFSALAMYGLVLSDQIENDLARQKKISEQNASLMMLQMRPHFIYNTLMSIYYLCEQDPKQAQSTILDFSTYLRKNFTAIAKEGMIPFREELEHTKAYLSVEQVRFGDKLSIEFDTPHLAFSLPPLTLQPIVENAVKHGIDPELDPLYIRISTRELSDASEITIEDTGPGFISGAGGSTFGGSGQGTAVGAGGSTFGGSWQGAAVGGNKEPHIALANIRERLSMMCGGTLVISEREGGGTIAKIVIPYRG